MEEIKENGVLIRDIKTKNVMTKSTLPVGGYSVNPYIGCTHNCKYCYASFMKRFTGHSEPWGAFLDVKHWPDIKNPQKYRGQRVVIGSVTDGYLPQEEVYGRTRSLLEQLKTSGAKLMICTKSDLVLRDLDLLTQMPDVTVSWSRTSKAIWTTPSALRDGWPPCKGSTRQVSEQYALQPRFFQALQTCPPLWSGSGINVILSGWKILICVVRSKQKFSPTSAESIRS